MRKVEVSGRDFAFAQRAPTPVEGLPDDLPMIGVFAARPQTDIGRACQVADNAHEFNKVREYA
nr:hypothetical protein [Methylocapsa sp. RX1]